MAKRIPIDVTFPNTRKIRSFRSVSAVARMLSGNGTASGGLRQQIIYKGTLGLFDQLVHGEPSKRTSVRRNRVYG